LKVEDFRNLESEIAQTHAAFALELGVSDVSVKRIATGTQVITEQMARQVIARVLIKREGLENKYKKLLAQYHHDTV
jgi:hypothetical protein